MTTFLLNVFGVCVAQILGVIVSEAPLELQVGHEEACFHEHVVKRVNVGLPPKWLVPPDPFSFSFSSKSHNWTQSLFGAKARCAGRYMIYILLFGNRMTHLAWESQC